MHRPSPLWLAALASSAPFWSGLFFGNVALAQHLGGGTVAVVQTSAARSDLTLVLAGFALVGFTMVAFITRSASGKGSGTRPGPQARVWMNVDVSVVRIAIDVRSREFMERELGKITTTGSPQSRPLLESLGAVVRLLRKCDTAWVYGGSSNYHPMSPPIAEGVFARHAREARATHPPSTAKPEGQDVALITVVVAARREIRDFFGGRRDEINAVFDDLERLTADELVALDVVWTPGDPDAHMSGTTLEAMMPDITRLPAVSGKKGRPVRRVHCAYCRGPFAAELPTCPHCGAPAPSEA